MRDVEPSVIKHIADALRSLQLADDETGYGLVSDHIANATEELIKAIKAGFIDSVNLYD